MTKYSGGICSYGDDYLSPYLGPDESREVIPNRATLSLEIDDSIWAEDDADQAVIHKRVGRGMPVTPSKSSGYISGDFGTECIFERVWIYPLLVGGSFITEEQDINIIIWNAFQFRSVDLTAIVGTETEGTILTHDTPPITLQIWGEKNYALTLLKDGPPVQDTIYTFTIDGVDYELLITGIRVIPVAPDPDWGKGVTISYEFETAMYQTSRFYEQRRTLVDKSWRKVSVSFDLKDRDKEKFFHQAVYGHDKVFGVPIYQEKLYPTAVAQGTSLITFSNTTDNMWNLLNRAAYIIIVDHGSYKSEIKAVDIISSGQITLDNPIVEDFDPETTYVYPCAFAVIDSLKFTQETDGVDAVDVDFKEFDNG